MCNSIYEKDRGEHIGVRSLKARCRAFKDFLLRRPERKLAIVGHSAFFRTLGCVEHIQNVAIWKAVLLEDGSWDGPATEEFAGCEGDTKSSLGDSAQRD